MSNLNPGGLTRVLNYIKTWVTGLLNGKANSSHTHTKSQITDFPAYGTAAGTICQGNDSRLSDARTPYFANGTWYAVGDDAAIGDHNVGGGLGVKALNSTTTRIDLCYKDDASNYKSITYDGTTLYMNGNCDYANSAGYVQGNNNSANAANALLRSGSGRGDSSPEGDTWIFLDELGGTSAPWGFKHNQAANTIGFYGAGTETSSINLSNGYFSGTAERSNYANSAGSANDPNAVHKSGDETIDGVKTYSSDIYSVSSQHLRFRHLDGSNNGGMDGCLFLNYDNNAKNVYFNGASYYINGGYYNGRAENAQYTYWLRTSSHADHLLHTEWDGSYFWTYVTAGDGGYRAVRVERSNSSGWADSAGKADYLGDIGSTDRNGASGTGWYSVGFSYSYDEGHNELAINNYWGIRLNCRDSAHVTINGSRINVENATYLNGYQVYVG